MFKKLALSAAGLMLLASPLAASAQTVTTVDSSNPNATLIAALISLVQVLEQELQQLIAQNATTPVPPPNPILCPVGEHSNGTMCVVEYKAASASIDPSSLTASTCTSGVYTGCKDAAAVTITGSASNVSQVIVNIKGQTPGYATVVNGRWSATIGNVFPNIYTVQIDDNDAGSNNGLVLTQGTLTVTGANSTQPSATIDQSSLTVSTDKDAALPTITGSATGGLGMYLAVSDLNGSNAFASDTFYSTNGHWSVALTHPLQNGSYKVTVVGPGYNSLASGTLVVHANAAESFTVSQTEGSTPLNLAFKGMVTCDDISGLRLDFGDGVSGGGFLSTVCANGISSEHTYMNAGTYTARLYTPSKTIGSVIVTVH